MDELKEETRVRLNVKQTAKGLIQMDITSEAPTVEKAGELLEGAIATLKAKVSDAGLNTTDEA